MDMIGRDEAIRLVHSVLYEMMMESADIDTPMSAEDKLLLRVNKAIATKLREMPSAQPKGRWVFANNNPVDRKLHILEEAFCSQCGNMAPGVPFWECDLDMTAFCPHCGADMRGEQDDSQ